VLDVGAGTGRYRGLFGHCDYRAQDRAQYAGTLTGPQREAWAYDRLDLVSDAAAIAVATGSIDAVLCTEVLEHVPDPVAVLAEIARVLRPGGRLFLTAPLGSGLHQEPSHFYGGFTPHFYRRVLGSCGLNILAITPNGGLFAHVAQELHRAAGLLEGRYPARHPARLIVWILLQHVLPAWLMGLDTRVPVPEFTVGYFVEAVRSPDAPTRIAAPSAVRAPRAAE
jgi:SAM-dependent methyltransferase